MKKFFAAIVLAGAMALASISTAAAQSGCPTIITGAVLTAAQWNACFQAKNDNLGYTPLNIAGGTMGGRLVTAAPGATLSGFNLIPGTAPGSPANGDLWVTSSGIFAQVNGATYNLKPSAPGAPIFILFSGQSNPENTFVYSWTPNPNALRWNGGSEGTVGTAFAPIDSTHISLPDKIASDIADLYPDSKVYMVGVFQSGTPISHWIGTAGGSDVYATIQANMTPALAAAGVNKINRFLWWQGESDVGSVTYTADLGTLWTRLQTNSWFPRETFSLLYSIGSTAQTGIVGSDAINIQISTFVGLDPDYRRNFYTPSFVGSTYWQPGVHMNAQGVFSAGAAGANVILTGGRPSVPATSYDPAGNAWVFGAPISLPQLTVTGVSGISLPGGGGISLSGGAVNGASFFNHVAITQPAGSSTLTIADGKTLAASNTLTFTGTDGSSVAFGAGGTVLYNGGALGTPSSGVGTNLTLLNASNLGSGTVPSGRIGFAAKSDMQTPTSSVLTVNPADVQNHPGVAKVTARLDGKTGSTCTIKESYNLTSCVRNSAGSYTLTFTTGFANTNYNPIIVSYASGVAPTQMVLPTFTSATVFSFFTATSAGSATDSDTIDVAMFGTQ